MSSEEAPGTSSSYYSTASSNCSSAENISSGTSTIENGDLSVFTFMMSRGLTLEQPLSAPPGSSNCVHMSNCRCACRTSKLHRSESTNSLAIDPFGVSPHRLICRTHDKYGKMSENSLFSDTYSRLLSQSTMDGSLLRSMEKGGVYKELKRVIPPDAWIHHKSDLLELSTPKKPTWLVLGYKSLEKTLDSTLEATWKEWTGCRHIYLNLRNDFEIRRISFFNRIYPDDNLDLFMYIVLMEIGNVDERNLMWLLDFVQRTRVERMKGFLTVYGEVDNEFATINDEYMKFVSSEKKSQSKSTEGLSDVGNQEINQNLKFIEKLLEEIHQTPIADYF